MRVRQDSKVLKKLHLEFRFPIIFYDLFIFMHSVIINREHLYAE